MKRLLGQSVVFGVAGALAFAATAFADDVKSDQGCAFNGRVRNWQDVDNHTAIIEVGPNHRYKVTFTDECREMRHAIFARLESHPGICVSAGDRMVFRPQHGLDDICVIRSVEKLPPSPATPAN